MRSADYHRLEQDFKEALNSIQSEYGCVRRCFICLRDTYNKEKGDVKAEEEKTLKNSEEFQKELKDFEDDLQGYAKLLAKLLGLVFAQHGTEDEFFFLAIDHYEELKTKLICLNELLNKQRAELPMIDFPKMKKVVLKEFKKQAKFIKDCFLSFENFEP